MSSKELKIKFNDIIAEYTKAFIDKHEFEDYDEDMWVAGCVGEIIMIGDMFVSFTDIKYDIDNDIDSDMFLKWYWKSLDCHEIGLDFPNYKNYCIGAPIPSDEKIEHIKSLRKELFELTGKQISTF